MTVRVKARVSFTVEVEYTVQNETSLDSCRAVGTEMARELVNNQLRDLPPDAHAKLVLAPRATAIEIAAKWGDSGD